MVKKKKVYKISSWADAPFSNIPNKVQLQKYSCLKIEMLSFIFRQSALEKEFCQVLMFDLIVCENILYFKLD